MRCLTVRQPYAWAIIHGGKDVENRTRNIAGSYRGPLLIHAAKQLADDDHLDDRVASAVGELARAGYPLPRVPQIAGDAPTPGNVITPWYGHLGGVIGVVDLVDVHKAARCVGIHGEHCSDWANPDGEHLVLANPRPFAEPIPYRGALGLWTFPDELLPEVAW